MQICAGQRGGSEPEPLFRAHHITRLAMLFECILGAQMCYACSHITSASTLTPSSASLPQHQRHQSSRQRENKQEVAASKQGTTSLHSKANLGPSTSSPHQPHLFALTYLAARAALDRKLPPPRLYLHNNCRRLRSTLFKLLSVRSCSSHARCKARCPSSDPALDPGDPIRRIDCHAYEARVGPG